MVSNLPSGVVTFLFSDIEGSAIVAQEHSAHWEDLRARHNAILRSATEAHNGHVFQVVGDAFCCAFHTPGDALMAALEVQRELQAEAGELATIRVRMGIHTGEAREQDGDYVGYLTLTRVQRVMSGAYGEQILVSNATAGLVRPALPPDVILMDLGEHKLKSLPDPEHIWQVVAPGLRQAFPPLEAPSHIPNNLPVELTSFVGREAELAEVRNLLGTHRLVTLTGPGGTGKTRLSMRVAADMLDSTRDGAWFVDLTSLADPALVPNAVASAVGLREEQGRPLMSTLLGWIGGREILLILDNCEHLITACASFVDTVLHAGRGPRVLATSREALGISGEMIYQVPSLEVPQPAQASQISLEELAQFPAVRLFSGRARESAPTFHLTEANSPAVVQICHRLDGIPLALELAAARVKVLRVEQVAERLDDRFRLLTGGGRTTLARHQTLRSLIDWSYGLLSDPERMLLGRLSVFAGGWALEAVEQVCAGGRLESGEILDLLTHLVDKSLVQVDDSSERSYYRMLETIRQYAREKLLESAEIEDINNRHLQFMLNMAQLAEAKTHSLDESAWFDRLELEIGNLRAALEWGLSRQDPVPVLALAGSLYWFSWVRGYIREAERWLTDAVARPGADKRTKERARALIALGWLRGTSGDYDSTRALFDEGISISREVGDPLVLAESLSTWCQWIAFAGYATAGPVLEESLALSRKLDYKLGMAKSLIGFGELQIYHGQDDDAQVSYVQCRTLLRELGDRNFLAYVVRRLGHIALRQSNYQTADELFAESLRLNLLQKDPHGVAACLAAYGSSAARQGNAARAARLYGATAMVLESFGGKLVPIDELENEPHIRTARASIREDEYERAYSEGRAMKTEGAIAYALKQRDE